MKCNLSWREKLSLIQYYKPSEEEILYTFNTTKEELDLAHSCMKEGILQPSKHLLIQFPENVFKNRSIQFSPSSFASKPRKIPQKRGRKGNKIETAFKELPNTPVDINDYAKQYGISVHILKQHYRFDTVGLPGIVCVRKTKTNNENKLMVWRQITH